MCVHVYCMGTHPLAAFCWPKALSLFTMRDFLKLGRLTPPPPIEIRDAGSTRGAKSRGTSWQTSADTLDVPTIMYDIYI